MKIKREKETFENVTITLESQEEVDALYGIVNFSPISNAINEAGSRLTLELWKALGNYRSKGYIKYWNAISNNFKE